jgi:ATP-binding cassette subfamily F protein 3
MVLKKTAARRAAQQAPPSTDSAGDDTQPVIECRAQQSRFWTDTLTSGIEIDLKDVSIAVGTGKDQRELLTNAHVRLKEGVRYGLVGRCGKTFLCLVRSYTH